nr:MAG TPA: hypothetical protein [Caudoviricetes sp.]
MPFARTKNTRRKRAKRKAKGWACGEIKSLPRRGSGENANLAS